MNHRLPCQRYLSTMLRDIPWEKERVIHFRNWAVAASTFTERLRAGTWFGVAEVEIEIPELLWLNFEEMLAFFLNKQIPDKAVPQRMKNHLAHTGRKRGDG